MLGKSDLAEVGVPGEIGRERAKLRPGPSCGSWLRDRGARRASWRLAPSAFRCSCTVRASAEACVGRVAGQLHHFRDVLHVLIAELLRVRRRPWCSSRGRAVPGRPGWPRRSPAGYSYRPVAEPKKKSARAPWLCRWATSSWSCASAGDGGDAVELRLDRLDAGGFDLLGVHASGVEIADLLLDGARRRVLILGGGFENLAQNLLILVLQLVEAAPAGILGLNGIALDPAAAGELEKVLAGLQVVSRSAGSKPWRSVRCRNGFRKAPQTARKAMTTTARIIRPENITSTLVFCMAAPEARVESSRIFAPSSPSQTAAAPAGDPVGSGWQPVVGGESTHRRGPGRHHAAHFLAPSCHICTESKHLSVVRALLR